MAIRSSHPDKIVGDGVPDVPCPACWIPFLLVGAHSVRPHHSRNTQEPQSFDCGSYFLSKQRSLQRRSGQVESVDHQIPRKKVCIFGCIVHLSEACTVRPVQRASFISQERNRTRVLAAPEHPVINREKVTHFKTCRPFFCRELRRAAVLPQTRCDLITTVSPINFCALCSPLIQAQISALRRISALRFKSLAISSNVMQIQMLRHSEEPRQPDLGIQYRSFFLHLCKIISGQNDQENNNQAKRKDE